MLWAEGFLLSFSTVFVLLLFLATRNPQLSVLLTGGLYLLLLPCRFQPVPESLAQQVLKPRGKVYSIAHRGGAQHDAPENTLAPSGHQIAQPPSCDLYVAAMLLSGAGDALGYRKQLWEYCKSGPQIHTELQELGGLQNITVSLPDWPVSDDTVLHLATGESLATGKLSEELYQELAARYVSAMTDMEGRKPGPTSILGTSQLRPGEHGGYKIPFNPLATGCGAAMRSMCIGLRFPRPSELSLLVAVSVESGKMTHNHPTGYLGSLASALFTSLSVRRVPLEQWGSILLETLPLALEYLRSTDSDAQRHVDEWDYFRQSWERYLSQRGLLQGAGPAVFPSPYGPAERDVEYSHWSLDGWPGRSGHDAPMIAYDALLGARGSWEELCSRSMFHGGDSDSTGVIAGCCWGALYGLTEVPKGNYSQLEYRGRMEAVAASLHKLAWGETTEAL